MCSFTKMDSENTGADLGLKVAGQEVNIRNVKSLNTIATVTTLLLVCVAITGGYLMFTAHAAETKDASKELVQALREMTTAAREQNCLISMPMDRRDPELCKRLSR